MTSKTVRTLASYRGMLWDLAGKQLKAKYAHSLLGIWIAVLTPLLVMLAITFVFTAVFDVRAEKFSLFVLSAIIPWMFFSHAVSEATVSLVSQRSLLRQFNIPAELVPLASVLANYLNYLIGWCLLYPLFLFFKPGAVVLFPLLVLVLALHLLFVSGVSLVLSASNVFFRDIGHLLGVVMMFWFWITPIFYKLEMVPESLRWICQLNPMTPFVLFYRSILFQGAWPEITVLLGAFLWSALALLAGFALFNNARPRLLKEM